MNEELRRQIAERRDGLAQIVADWYGCVNDWPPHDEWEGWQLVNDVSAWVLDLLAAQPAAVSLPEEARCELCHDAIEQNEACVLDPTGDRWHLCNRFGVDCWEYANTPLPPAPAVSLELPEPPRRTPNREPQPSDGPDFWADHAAWKAQQSTEPPIEDAGSGGVR